MSMNDETTYRAAPGVSSSRLKKMRDSPLHYAVNYNKDSSNRAFLRAQHEALLRPDVYASTYAVCDVRRDTRTKAYQAWLEEHEGVTALTQDEADRIATLRDAVMAHPVAGPMLGRGVPEIPLYWTDPETGLDCKGRVDRITKTGRFVVDCKGYGTSDPRQIARRVVQLGAHIQAAHYCAGVEAVYGWRPRYYVVSYEQGPPWDVCVVELTEESALLAGEMERRRLLQRVAECEASGRWPGRHEDVVELLLPPWAWGDDEDMIEVGG